MAPDDLSDFQPSPAHEAARLRLPRLAAAAAARRNGLLAALHGARCELGEITAAIEPQPPSGVALRWLCGLSTQPVTVDGAPARWLAAAAAPDLPEALVELSRLEPLLAAAETGLGVALDPDHMSSRADPEALSLRLAVRDSDGRERHALRMFVPASTMLHLRPPAPRLSRLGAAARARLRLRLSVEGPSAPISELASLAIGDLVLAGGAEWRATLAAAGVPAIVGRWRPATGSFQYEGRMDDDKAPPPMADEGGLDAALAVRLRLELGEVEVGLAELAALAPGAVLKVELAGNAPRVAVTANGARIASGRLVSLGEAYGVLVDEVAPAVAGAAAG